MRRGIPDVEHAAPAFRPGRGRDREDRRPAQEDPGGQDRDGGDEAGQGNTDPHVEEAPAVQEGLFDLDEGPRRAERRQPGEREGQREGGVHHMP